jgi:glycosyltransferase involved in cell wall biosynthesis
LIASELKRQTGIPWVADFRDLWSHNPYFKKTQPFQFLEERWEKRIMKGCDFMVTVSEPLAKNLEAFHLKNTKVIYNGFDEEDFTARVLPIPKFTISFTGHIFTQHVDPNVFLQSLAELKHEGIISSDNIAVRFFGEYPLNNPALLSKMYCVQDIVQTYDPIPMRESIKKQMESTILLLITWDDAKASGVLSSKIFEYMAAGKPVLAISYQSGSLKQLIDESGIGIVVSSVAQIKETLVQWLSEFEQYGKIITHYQPVPEVIKLYTREKEAGQLANVFDEVCLRK